MKIYLDTNIYCRPLDDRMQPRIYLEAEACLFILGKIENQEIKTFGSDILLYELGQADKIKQSYILPFVRFWQSNITLSDEIVRKARNIQKKYHIGSRDAIHLVSAMEAGCRYFLTCDDQLISKCEKFTKIKIINPVDFIKEEKL